MNMFNKNELNRNYVVDIELLRMEILIEQQENYEKEFLSIESPTDELDYHILQYESLIENYEINCPTDDFEEEFDYLFEQEDSLMNMRDEVLIKEYGNEESFEFIGLEFIDEDIFDYQIESFEQDNFLEETVPDYDFDPEDYEDMQYEEEMSWEIHYLRESQFETQSQCGCPYDDYMPNDDGLCDYLDCYDYPEGPNENLSGIKYF